MDASAEKVMDLCVVSPEFDLDPFKPIGDGTRHSILDIVLKDYISTDPEVSGLLDAFHFSADGRTFTGRVASDAKWRDGAHLTPREAALGIARGLHYRAGSESIRVVGTEGIKDSGWEKRNYTGVKIIDDRQFELTFDDAPQVANRVGVVRELLSSGALSNRLWPARFETTSSVAADGLGDFVSPYAFRKLGKDLQILIGKHAVNVHLDGRCATPDFTSSAIPNVSSDQPGFDVSKSGREMALLAIFNSNRPNFKTVDERKRAASWLRHVIEQANLEPQGARLSSGHFEKMEPGFDSKVIWSSSAGTPKVKDLTILAGNKAIPLIREGAAIEVAAKAAGIKIHWVYRSAELNNPPSSWGPERAAGLA
jgi:hypothetical protein